MSPIIYTPHDCEKPEGNLPAGTLYQCPECDRVWERGTDVFEDDTNLHWWVEEDPRRTAILREACAQNNPPATPKVTPAMVQLVVDTYTSHARLTYFDDGTQTECRGCLDGPKYDRHTIQAHAREKAAEVLQDALRGETRG